MGMYKKKVKLSTVATFIVEQSLTAKFFIVVTDVQKQSTASDTSLAQQTFLPKYM